MLELIYDGIGDDRPDLKNMAPHTYNQATQREHQNHVHAVPREHGGPVDPSVLYEVGERGRELVRFDRPGEVYPTEQATRLLTPAAMPGYGPAGTGGAVFDYDRFVTAFVGQLANKTTTLNIDATGLGAREMAQLVPTEMAQREWLSNGH